MGEGCQHCRILSSPGFDLCPHCGRPKGEDWATDWQTIELKGGILRIDGETVTHAEGTGDTLPCGKLTANDH